MLRRLLYLRKIMILPYAQILRRVFASEREMEMTQTETLRRLAARTRKVRNAEFKKAEARAVTAIDKFWAGSCLASVLRDYQAGRVTTIKAGR
jgi:hypothetical protein